MIERLGLKTRRNSSSANVNGLVNFSNLLIEEPNRETLDLSRGTQRLSNHISQRLESETSKDFIKITTSPGGPTSPTPGARIDHNTSDDAFKANYSTEILSKKSTLSLKTSFHLINITLMGLCKVFKNIEFRMKTEFIV